MPCLLDIVGIQLSFMYFLLFQVPAVQDGRYSNDIYGLSHEFIIY